jgi:hypothetical protein
LKWPLIRFKISLIITLVKNKATLKLFSHMIADLCTLNLEV